MTNKDILELNNTLISPEVTKIEDRIVAYSVVKNRMAVENEVKIFNEMKKVHPKTEEYEKFRQETCEKWCEKDEEGNPIVENDRYRIVDNKAFQEDFNKGINESYAEVIDFINKENARTENFLNSESVVELSKVSIDKFPVDISAEMLYKLRFMIKDM